MDIRFPFQFDREGGTATSVRDDHIRQMIEQVLFTNPGERVNRPDFGSGLLQLVFTPNSDQLAATVQASVHGSLQHWLGDVIEVRELDVNNIDSRLTVSVSYVVNRTGEERVDSFERSVSSSSAPGMICDVDRRRELLRDTNHGAQSGEKWNGIDYVDVCCDNGNGPKQLHVYFLCPTSKEISVSDFELLDGFGRRVDDAFEPGDVRSPPPPLKLPLKRKLHAGVWYLRFLQTDHIDPRHAKFEFIVDSGSVTDIDPRPTDDCPPQKAAEPEVNYLARDFASLRRVILDRLALIMPDWQERHIPDLGMTLVELLAYVGDHLSYYQDAVATEAYLGTARSRISVRRHTRLIDYSLHEGCNARTFLHLSVAGNPTIEPENLYFITRPADPELAKKPILAHHELQFELPKSFVPFEIIPEPNDCASLTCNDIVDSTALIGAFVSGSNDLARYIHDCLPNDLKTALRNCAVSAITPPPLDLLQSLVDALNVVLGQHFWWDKFIDMVGQATSDDSKADHLRQLKVWEQLPECNREILNLAFPDWIARPHTGDTRIPLFEAHNAIRFYTWNQEECCLPAGATMATLIDEDYRPHDETPGECSGCVEHSVGKRKLELSRGDLLLLEEVLGPRTHNPADADPNHRHVVRLTCVRRANDPVTGQALVEIEWHELDALPFPLCISSVGLPPECRLRENISLARANVLLVDHGRTIEAPEELGIVPAEVAAADCGDDGQCDAQHSRRPASAVFRPQLEEGDLTFAEPLKPCLPASKVRRQEAHSAIPRIWLQSSPTRDSDQNAGVNGSVMRRPLFAYAEAVEPLKLLERSAEIQGADRWRLQNLLSPVSAAFLEEFSTQMTMNANAYAMQQGFDDTMSLFHVGISGSRSKSQQAFLDRRARFASDLKDAVSWTVQPHLLDSNADQRHFVIEMDNDRRAALRFGDGDLGKRPEPGTMFWAKYRSGNGPVGNVGTGKITHVVYRRTPVPGIVGVRNPLPAAGGTEPENLDHARMHAPHAFRDPQRAITAEDYRQLVLRDFAEEVQQARATLHWTGSQFVVAVTVDPVAGVRDVRELHDRIQKHLDRMRRIGHCVDVQPPIYVPLDIALTICVKSGHLRAHVQRELLAVFSNRILPDGTKGFFHADNLTFGDSIFLSRLVWTAKRVSGVENVTVDKLRRYGQGDHGELTAGVLTLGPLEIPLIENDRNRRHCGQLCLNMRGAR